MTLYTDRYLKESLYSLDVLGLKKEEADLVFSLLSNKAYVIPYPGYGNIVQESDDDSLFVGINKIFEEKLPSLAHFYAHTLSPYYHHPNLEVIKNSKQNDVDFYWDNNFFPRGDARTLYAMLASHNPKVMLEVGSGNSTRIARKAINDFSLQTKILSIDPSPRAVIANITDMHIQQSITSVPVSQFESLNEGDFLFIDGSHVALSGTDVPFYALNIFPLIKKGVIVHIHDISLPWDYYPPFRARHYNEQYVVGAFVASPASWEVYFPVHYLFRKHILPTDTPGGSFWLKKIS